MIHCLYHSFQESDHAAFGCIRPCTCSPAQDFICITSNSRVVLLSTIIHNIQLPVQQAFHDFAVALPEEQCTSDFYGENFS